jgi:hypothetical protein
VAGSSGPCGPQAFRHLDDVDPNQVTVDPFSGQPLLLQVIRARTHTIVTVNIEFCDDDGDPMTAWREDTGEQLAIDASGATSFQVTSGEPNDVYVHVGCTDGIDTVRGTVVIRFRDNTPPVIIPKPPGGGSTVARLQQKMLMTWYKWTGMPLSSGLMLVREEPASNSPVPR